MFRRNGLNAPRAPKVPGTRCITIGALERGADNKFMSAEVTAVSPAILIVEDEFLVLLFAVDALEDAGFRVLRAETAAQALQVLRAEPDVRAAIIDMGLPDRAGDLLAAEVQALRPDLPMVIASGRSGRELRERFGQRAGVATLVKPYTAQLLLEALAEVGVTPSDCGSARREDSPA
jgi:CheY-like chemotaxis protein